MVVSRLMGWAREHVVLYVLGCVALGVSGGLLLSALAAELGLWVIVAFSVTALALAARNLVPGRYALRLRGRDSGLVSDIPFLDFARREQAEQWATGRDTDFVEWEVVDRGPLWRRLRRR